MSRASGRDRIRIAFVLTELTLGGAEMMLYKLLSRIDRRRFDPYVLGLSDRTDDMLRLLREIHVPFESMGMTPKLTALAGILRLARSLRRIEPDLIQGWLYHGDLAATLARALLRAPRPPLLWSVRGTLISGEKRSVKAVISACARLSWLPQKITYNSTASAMEHEQSVGYRSGHRVVLPNGFDTDLFKPSAEARMVVRQQLGIAAGTVVVGLFGRYHPMKDHENFLRAAAIVSASHPQVHYLLAGENVDASNPRLRRTIEEFGVTGCTSLLGLRNDMPRIMAAVDIATSSSASGEGFPNVVGEAMSCGVPCVVTDVGDSAWIVGDAGYSVPPRDPQALAAGIRKLVDAGADARRDLGHRARRSVIERFSLDAIVRRYEDLYTHVHTGMPEAVS